MFLKVLVILVAIAVVGIAVLRSRRPHVTPAPAPTPTPQPAKRPAPKFLGFFWELTTVRLWQFGEIIGLSPMAGYHTCEDDGPGTPKHQTNGIVDNGSGPYEMFITAVIRSTGRRIPIYDLTGPGYNVAGNELHGRWVPVQGCMMYGCSERPWGAVGALTNCNTFVPFPEYVAGLKAEEKAAGCGTCPTPGPGNVIDTTLPTALVDVTLLIRNADGVVSDPYVRTMEIQTRSCK